MTDADIDQIVEYVDLNAPISDVWSALTDYQEFGQWFHVALDQPFEVGEISTGRITYPGHEGTKWVAYVDVLEPQSRFVFRWYDAENGSAEPGEGQPAIRVTFDLHKIGGGTRLTITESGFAALPKPRRLNLMNDCREGWKIQARNISTYLSRPECPPSLCHPALDAGSRTFESRCHVTTYFAGSRLTLCLAGITDSACHPALDAGSRELESRCKLTACWSRSRISGYATAVAFSNYFPSTGRKIGFATVYEACGMTRHYCHPGLDPGSREMKSRCKLTACWSRSRIFASLRAG